MATLRLNYRRVDALRPHKSTYADHFLVRAETAR